MKSWKKQCLQDSLPAMLLSLAACGSNGESSDSDSNSADGVTTLLMYQVGDKPENFDQLMEIANKRIEEKINARIDLQYIGWGDWDQK